MATFDRELWTARAWERHTKAIQAGTDQVRSTMRWIEDLKYIDALRVVVEWCEARSLAVVFSKRSDGIYFAADKEIRVSGRASPKHQLHILLHESGHHLIGNKEKHQRYGMGYTNDDPHVKRTFHHRLDILEEEYEAWHRGWKLGSRLGVLSKHDKVPFDRTRVRMLRTYILWASKAPGYEKYDDPAEGEPVD